MARTCKIEATASIRVFKNDVNHLNSIVDEIQKTKGIRLSHTQIFRILLRVAAGKEETFAFFFSNPIKTTKNLTKDTK